MNRRSLRVLFVCLAIGVGTSSNAYAQVNPINVTALPLPCTTSADGTNFGSPTDDDTPAFECAINLLPASGGEIYIPAGKYLLKRTLNVTNKPVAFRGEGQRITNLVWKETGSGGGISFLSTTGPLNHTLVVKSMSLLRDGAGGTAITGTWQTPTTQHSFGGTSATIFDVHIMSDPWPEVPTWQYGIRLINATGARISVFAIHGLSFFENESAISIAGRSIGVSINDGDIGRYKRGVEVDGQSENVVVEDVDSTENTWSFVFTTTGKGHTISNCHSAVAINSVTIVNSSDVAITDNLFYGNFANYAGIDILNNIVPGSRFRIRGNTIIGFDDPTTEPNETLAFHGIILSGTVTDSVLMANHTRDMGLAIWLQPNVSDTIVVANRNENTLLQVVDQGTNNHQGDNH